MTQNNKNKFFIDPIVIDEKPSREEETEEIKVEDDIEDDGGYLNEPTKWADVNEDDDELFNFLNEMKQDVIDDKFTDDINFSQELVSESALGKSMLDNYNKKVMKTENFQVFGQASKTIEKSVKSFLIQEYIGENEIFDSNSVRPFIKTKNVMDEIYKSLFQTRGHGAVDSVAKSSTDNMLQKLNSIKDRVDIIIDPLKKRLKELEEIKRAEDIFLLEQKTIYYLDQNIADPSGNKDKTLANINLAVKQIKNKIGNSSLADKSNSEDISNYMNMLTSLFTYQNDGDTSAGSEKATDFMIDCLRDRIVNSLQSLNKVDEDL